MKKKFFQKKSHSVEKCKRGDPSGFINKHSVAKYQKTQRGDPLGTLKNFRKKVAQFRKKSKGFVCFVCLFEKVKNERGDPLE